MDTNPYKVITGKKNPGDVEKEEISMEGKSLEVLLRVVKHLTLDFKENNKGEYAYVLLPDGQKISYPSPEFNKMMLQLAVDKSRR